MGMLPGKLFEMTSRLAEILRALEASGIRIEIGDDFAEYRALRGQQADRGAIYPMFDVASSYVDRSNAFWLCGYDGDGELMHTQAVRLLDLEGVSLANHLDAHRHKYITPDTTPDPDLTFYSGPDALKTITGQVCYQGDFWLRARGLGGPRSQGATALLSRVLLEVMAGAWNPSYVFAFVPKRLGAKGAHLRYGYNHCEPGRWIGPDRQVTEEDYFIWMNASDIAGLMGREAVEVQYSAELSGKRSTAPAKSDAPAGATADA